MNLSHFATTIGHPLCDYMDTIKFNKANTNKQKIYFLSGDPTVYGNNKFKMPEQGYQIMRKSIQNPDNHGYTLASGIPAAREAVIKLYKPKNLITINNCVIQHGVNQGLVAAIMSFTNASDEILVPQIGYPIFQKLAPSLGVKVLHYKLKPNQNYQIDLEHLESIITDKCQFIFIINPSNPMGTIFSLSHMQQILKFCDRHQLPIVSDQVYHGETFEGVDFYSFGDVTDDVPVLVLCGVQKLLSVPGWCTSWSVLFDKHNYLQGIWKNILTCGTIFLHSNKFTQIALPDILEKVGQFTKNPIKQTKALHDHLHEQFKAIKGFTPVTAHGTFYITVLVDTSIYTDICNDIELAQKLLQEQNIGVLPLSIFGGNLYGLRLLTCAKPEIYQEFLKRMKQFNARHQKNE